MTQELAGKVAVITGSSRGIGKACALRFAEAGARVVINYRTHAADALAVQTEILERTGQESLCIQADVAVLSDVQRMFDQVMQHWGQVDILVNNAGIYRDSLLLRMKEEDWLDVLHTNLNSLFYCTKTAAKIMLRQKSGRIVNIASVVGLIGNEGQANYATAKAGILGFTKTLARELAPRHIAVNAVAPGYIDSEMTEGLSDSVRADVMRKIPYQRFGECSEVAEVVLFLSSDRCRYLTGQTLNVDGGMVMS